MLFTSDASTDAQSIFFRTDTGTIVAPFGNTSLEALLRTRLSFMVRFTVRTGAEIKYNSRICRIINIQVFPDQKICIGKGF